MSDDEADPELLELLRKSLGIGRKTNEITSDIKVLSSAEYIYSNSIDVAIDRAATVAAADAIWTEMQRRSYSRQAWAEHELHPKTKDEATLNFIFTMDLLNFSFWSELDKERRFAVTYRGKRWTGYWGLVACLQRALDEGIPITTPDFWIERPDVVPAAEDHAAPPDLMETTEHEVNGDADVEAEGAAPLDHAHETETPFLTEDILRQVFRGEGEEEMPLLAERLDVVREASRVLGGSFEGSVAALIRRADGSAGKLVNLLAHHFDCFRDEAKFDGRKVRILKRAQIFAADVWAAFDGEGYGAFDDIDCITMFADYRVPQQLHSLGCLSYSPSLDYAIRSKKIIEPGSSREIQLRGCSIWVVELIRRTIQAEHPDAQVNAILIDFFLYDLAKERERAGEESIPHHRTRSIWY